MRKLLLLLLIFLPPTVFSQQYEEDRILFSQVLAENLRDYNQKADLAYRYNDYDRGKELFENFTNNQLEGSYMDNVGFRNLKKKEVKLYDYEKPVFLITYASWCVPSKGEIPALNDLAANYQGEINFIVLFWDKRDTAKELAEQFSSDISVLYVDETENEGAYAVKLLKHSLGLPTCFLLSENKQIKEIRRSVFPPMGTDQDKAYRENYIALETSISNSLFSTMDGGMYAESNSLDDE